MSIRGGVAPFFRKYSGVHLYSERLEAVSPVGILINVLTLGGELQTIPPGVNQIRSKRLWFRLNNQSDNCTS